jgi:nucleotide-binding universal stress UspA family protein
VCTIYEKILLGLDSSEDAKRAAEKAAELQNKLGSELVVFHSIEHHMLPKVIPLTVPFLNATHYTIPPVDRRKIMEEYEKQGQALLNEAEKMFNLHEVPIEKRLITEESPEDYINRVVDEENFDLIVLGCKGHHSKLKQIFMGTVATKVLNNANCDVLIVR